MLHVVGWFGTVLVLLAYIQVNRKAWSAHSKIFQYCNLLGSFALVVTAFSSNAWPSVVLNALWALVALHSLFKRLSHD